MRYLLSVVLLSACAHSGPEPGAITDRSELVLGARFLEPARQLDNPSLVDLHQHALETLHACGERLEALDVKARGQVAAPRGAALAGLLTGVTAGAFSGAAALVPEGSARQRYATATGVVGSAASGALGAASLATLATDPTRAARRVGELRIAVEDFLIGWDRAVADPQNACVAAPAAPAIVWSPPAADPLSVTDNPWGAPPSDGWAKGPDTVDPWGVDAPAPLPRPVDPFGGPPSSASADWSRERGPGSACLAVPQRGELGSTWGRGRAWDVLGADLGQPRCHLAAAEARAFSAELRGLVRGLEQRCVGGPDNLPAAQSEPNRTPTPTPTETCT